MRITSTKPREIAVVGGGAAGFFAALSAAEGDPSARVTIYERGNRFLTKVKISGGGRCNVTHGCFDPAVLATHYPRGSRELRAAFHRWQPRDTVECFRERGVALKTEADGRVFPVTDDSQTIIDCFFQSARKAGILILNGIGLADLATIPEGGFVLRLSNGETAFANAVCLAAGSLKASPLLDCLKRLGHTVEPLVPSLFAFNVKDPRLEGLAGLSVPNARVRILPRSEPRSGPLLVTHRGLSGPAVLRLSAWEARTLAEQGYRFAIAVNWLGEDSREKLRETFSTLRKSKGKSAIKSTSGDFVPRRLWERLVTAAGIDPSTPWARLTRDQEAALIEQLLNGRYEVDGKTTNKEEFVTAGGVRLKEVDFRTMESRIVPGLYFAGECLDLDGITGGFNFQAAWTTGYIAGEAMTRDPDESER